jgi:hypothetical protein
VRSDQPGGRSPGAVEMTVSSSSEEALPALTELIGVLKDQHH